jgi:16S rRNA processing protein RimM
LPEDVYYIDEIEGLNVFTESGELLGNVDYVMTTGGVDVYVIRKGNSELMLPAKKEFVLSVNIKEKKMIVKLPEGLKEIYEEEIE